MVKTRKLRTLKKKYNKNNKHTKYNKNNNYNNYNNYNGGMLENEGLPQATILSQFAITDENLRNFNRTFNNPRDCVINALHIMGIIDNVTANIMRIVNNRQYNTITKEQIEIIFAYVIGKNFEFKSTTNYNKWYNFINTYLTPGNVVFAGYIGHVFLIGRSMDNKIIYIDPHVPQSPCDLNLPECQQYLLGKNRWFVLCHSQQTLTQEQADKILAYLQRV